MSVSLMTMEPFSGFSRPTRDFRNTDLPVPDGPRSTEISPGGRVSVTSLQMFWLPKDLVSPSTCTATPTVLLDLLRLHCRPRTPRRPGVYRWVTTPGRRGYVCHGVSVTRVSTLWPAETHPATRRHRNGRRGRPPDGGRPLLVTRWNGPGVGTRPE